MLLPASCYFQPYVTSNLVVLPASWYYKPHVTFSVVLLPVSCYFQSHYFQPRVTVSLMLLPQISVETFFLAPYHKCLQNPPFAAIGVPYKVINRQNQNIVDW
jgi:hypothetical protein